MDQNTENNQDANENALDGDAPRNLNALESLSSSDGVALDPSSAPGEAPKPKQNPFKRFWSSFSVYLLIFFLLVVVTGIVFVVSYINSQKEPELPSTALQDLTQEELNDIATGDASVGDPRYILNVQSDAVFAGNALIRGDLNVAGSVQLGEGLTIPTLTVSGASNLQAVQANTLAVAGATTLQGALTLQNSANISRDLSVGGASVFNGSLTATSITTGNLTLAGNGTLTINNHLVTNGPTPSRSNGNALGGGGSSSVSGSDTAGTVNISTGNSPQPGCFATITFRQAFNGQPTVIVTPIGDAAGRLNYYVNRSSTNFSICTANSAQAGRTFGFDYFVVN